MTDVIEVMAVESFVTEVLFDEGRPGASVQLGRDATHLLWRMVGADEWIQLVALADLQGADGAAGAAGESPELRVDAGMVQWRLPSSPTWTDLVSVASLSGPAGADGADGEAPELRVDSGWVQWRLPSSPAWTNLIAVSALQGPAGVDGADGAPGVDGAPGADGVDGEAPQLRVDSGFVQWKLPSDVVWANLVALSAITGPAGADGSDGAPGADGAPGVGVPAGGSTGQVLKKTSGTDYATGWSADLAIASGSAMNPHTSKAAARNSALPKNFWQYTGTVGVDDPDNAVAGDEWISA